MFVSLFHYRLVNAGMIPAKDLAANNTFTVLFVGVLLLPLLEYISCEFYVSGLSTHSHVVPPMKYRDELIDIKFNGL